MTISNPKVITKHGWRQLVLNWLEQHIPPPRIQHIHRVETMAVQLAQHHGLDTTKAAQAGLLHDLAKYFSAEQLLNIALAEQFCLDPVDTAHPHLLHAPVSAIIARDQFQVQDPEILAAISNHTLGQPDMSMLSCVVFLADSLEPGRGDRPKLNLIRDMSQHDLYQAVWMTCDVTLRHLLKTHRLIHPRMLATRNWALQLSPP